MYRITVNSKNLFEELFLGSIPTKSTTSPGHYIRPSSTVPRGTGISSNDRHLSTATSPSPATPTTLDELTAVERTTTSSASPRPYIGKISPTLSTTVLIRSSSPTPSPSPCRIILSRLRKRVRLINKGCLSSIFTVPRVESRTWTFSASVISPIRPPTRGVPIGKRVTIRECDLFSFSGGRRKKKRGGGGFHFNASLQMYEYILC